MQELEDALRLRYESRGLELKGPGDRTDSHMLAKVTRAALSLGNLRDGGHIIIGIEDSDPASLGPGLDPVQHTSWLAYDDVARKMGEYADPPIEFTLASLRLSSGANVAVIQVNEFADIPHICSKQFDPVLRKGALYVRPRKVPETAEVASSIEMREVIELATEKALRAYVETAQRAGIALSVPTTGAPPVPAMEERFEEQRRGAWE